MMVRQLFTWELGDLTDVARSFHADTNLGGEFSEANWTDHIHALAVTGRLGAFGVFRDGKLVGALVAQIGPHSMVDVLVATELFWYITPENRGGTAGPRLLAEFEKWAEKSGADVVIMAHFHGSERLHDLYVKRGYQEIETHYLKWPSPPQQ